MAGTLKFLADECCDAGLVSTLRSSGYDVTYVTEQCAGASDDEVLLKAYNEGRILLTEDKDFGELSYRLRKPSAGIVLMRSRNPCPLGMVRVQRLCHLNSSLLPQS